MQGFLKAAMFGAASLVYTPQAMGQDIQLPGFGTAEAIQPQEQNKYIGLAICFALDESISMDSLDKQHQREAHYAALTDPRVMDAILAVPDGVVACGIRYSTNATVDINWVPLNSEQEIFEFAHTMKNLDPYYPDQLITNHAAAVQAANNMMAQLQEDRIYPARSVLDLATDGIDNVNNLVPQLNPWTSYDLEAELDIAQYENAMTVNVLAMRDYGDALTRIVPTYEAHVQRLWEESVTPAGFVQETEDENGFAGGKFVEALIQKLLLEIADNSYHPEDPEQRSSPHISAG